MFKTTSLYVQHRVGTLAGQPEHRGVSNSRHLGPQAALLTKWVNLVSDQLILELHHPQVNSSPRLADPGSNPNKLQRADLVTCRLPPILEPRSPNEAQHKPLKVLGTPSCRHAMYKQAEAMASLLRPFRVFDTFTCLNRASARSCPQTLYTECCIKTTACGKNSSLWVAYNSIDSWMQCYGLTCAATAREVMTIQQDTLVQGGPN